MSMPIRTVYSDADIGAETGEKIAVYLSLYLVNVACGTNEY